MESTFLSQRSQKCVISNLEISSGKTKQTHKSSPFDLHFYVI